MRAIALVFALFVMLAPAPASAQALGTFTWQLEPYCNVVAFTVTPDGAAYRLTGYDDRCGAGTMPAAGVVTPNADGTFTLAFYLITPSGRAGHTTATLAPGAYSGPWQDDGGLTGTLRFGGASSGGAVRPVPEFQRRVTGGCPAGEFVQTVGADGSVQCGAATGTGGGDITGVTAGTGLVGGGASGDVTLGIAASGVGSAQIADGSIRAVDVNANEVQLRVARTCPAGSYYSAIALAGNATCSAGGSGSNAALGFGALAADVSGLNSNVAVGHEALAANTLGRLNAAVGSFALTSNTTGGDNAAFGFGALTTNSTGSGNVAVGRYALRSNTTGLSNVAVGWEALRSNTTGLSNVAVGWEALRSNTDAGFNVAVGVAALRNTTTGSHNVAVGSHAGEAISGGYRNTALGYAALADVTNGVRNIAIGFLAGAAVTTGTDNIHIGWEGNVNESDTIRIGRLQTRAFIDGIRGVTTGNANAVAVLIDSAGQLGTISSSRRTKEDIHDMGAASAALFRLRPVTFRYIQPYADGSKPRDYGLIAEEVAEIYPDLVVRNEAGEVETVQYHKLVPMLLNEVQRLRRDLDEQRSTIEALRTRSEQRAPSQ